MAPVPTHSPVTGQPVPAHYVHSSSVHFQDTHGRSLLLRGVNLSGGAKAPHGQPSHSAQGFWEEAEAGRGDFVNRPLNLDDGSADVHLARLRAWGYNFLRYVFTWEALEHEGPGKYDTEYMDYVVRVLHKCKEWGFRVFMDPHQDVWSRFSGGSGAPLWTLYACGIDPMNITPTFSAYLHHEYPSRENPKPQEFPQMIWATNYTRLLSHTVWTLFFAGKAYAPKCIIDGVNIQDYLQEKYINAVAALAQRIAKEDGLYDEVVIGWDSMNEPGDGLVGYENLDVIPKEQRLKKGPSPTAFQGMQLGMGQAVEADVWDFTQMGPKNAGKIVMDPKGVKLWLKPEEEATRGGGKWGWKRDAGWKLGECIWAQHGVWDSASSKLLRPDYFRYLPNDTKKVANVTTDFWRTHWLSYAAKIRQHHPEAIHFVQPPVFVVPPELPQSLIKGRMATAPHYYDGLTLMTKHWNWFNADALGLLRGKYWTMLQAIKIGEPAIRNCIQYQLGILKQDTKDVYGDYPTLIGEIGCPYDMDDKKAYGFVDGGKGEGDYTSQQKAWDASMNAADGPNCLNYTLWTYVPDNSHEWGDLWNGEDLSIWSADDAKKTELFLDSNKAQSQTTLSASVNSSSASTLVSGGSSAPTPKGINSGEGITSALLLNGSRAVGAVVRPYPAASVGTPLRLDFDIASTTFKLQIKVASTDSVPSGVCTEIYLPFIHYAASLDPYTTGTISRNSSKASLLGGKSTGRSSPSAPEGALRLSVDVTTSHGSYELQGQRLLWKYDVPSSGEAVYTIEVKRTGGAMGRELGYVQSSGGWGEIYALVRSLGVDLRA